MGDSAEKLLLLLVATSVALGIALVIRAVRIARNTRNFPDDHKLEETIALIRQWKLQGLGYRQCFDRLAAQGFRKDVADAILGQTERRSIANGGERNTSQR